MKHISLIDDNTRRRQSLTVLLTSVGGYEVESFRAFSHIPPNAKTDLVLIAEHMLDKSADYSDFPIVSFGHSLAPLGNIPHLTLQHFPAFAQQVRGVIERI